MTKKEALKRITDLVRNLDEQGKKTPWYRPIGNVQRYIDRYFRPNNTVYSTDGLSKFSSVPMIRIDPGKSPMGRICIKSLYKEHVLAAPELNEWELVGWQFCRYNKRIQEALAYYYYQPGLIAAEGGRKIPEVQVDPLPLMRTLGSTLANCGYRWSIMSDVPNNVLVDSFDSPSYRSGRLYEEPFDLKESKAVNAFVKKATVGVAVRVVLQDWILHPSRLDFLKKIKEDPMIRIIRPAHLSRRTGHACIRLMIGRQRWKTWEEICNEGTGVVPTNPSRRWRENEEYA